MTQFKGTPGPWSSSEGWADGHDSIDAPGHGAIAQVLNSMEWEGGDESEDNPRYRSYLEENKEFEANIRLIVEAPEMYNALHQVVPYLRDAAKTDGHAFGTLQLITQILKRVEGQHV